MAIELFLLPMAQIDRGWGPRWDIKYIDTITPTGPSGMIRYQPNEADSDVIALIEASQSDLNSVASQLDVTRLATRDNLDTPINAGQATAAKAIFEAAFIPGLFINAGDTRREVIRGVVGMFLFSQRMTGRFGTGWRKRAQDLGITFASTWTTFPQALKDEFIDVRDSFGWEGNLGITGTSTLRDIMKVVSDQFEDTPIFIAGHEI